jgi:transcription termination factor Rho
MSVLDPSELEASPLADLHAIASELGLEGYRRLRKEQLIDQIVSAQGGGSAATADAVPEKEEEAEKPEDEKPERPKRGLRRRKPKAEEEPAPEPDAAPEQEPEAEAAPEPEPEPESDEPEDEPAEEPDEPEEEDIRSGILDVLPNGSGFIRAEPYTQSRADVYVSPAQIRRCELRPGDEVSGPVRPPRRNERHPSLVHVAQVNGQDPEAQPERSRLDGLTAVWPTQRLAGPGLLSDSPYGRGSRVAIGGPPGAGATSLLREAVKVLRDRHDEIEIIVVLAGVRPEEVVEWQDLGAQVAGGSFESSVDEQAQVADLAVQRAQRTAEQGRDAVVVIDSLDALPPAVARRVFGAGRNTQDAGSVTVLASTGSAAEPHRMATTHVTLEPNTGGEPRVASSGTLRKDLLG